MSKHIAYDTKLKQIPKMSWKTCEKYSLMLDSAISDNTCDQTF